MKRSVLRALLAGLLCLTLAACGVDDEIFAPEVERLTPAGDMYDDAEEAMGSSDQTWAIYWYLCGSDLETYHGSATHGLMEMMEVYLPENVKVIIQTGGANLWQNNMVSAGVIQRFVYDSEGFRLVDEQPDANMGDPETLSGFLNFCADNYPADRTMVLFWNHGGGSVLGAAFDENHGNDSLTLSELYSAFNEVYELSMEEPPIDVIGFDTCLMATIDVAYTFCDVPDRGHRPELLLLLITATITTIWAIPTRGSATPSSTSTATSSPGN